MNDLHGITVSDLFQDFRKCCSIYFDELLFDFSRVADSHEHSLTCNLLRSMLNCFSPSSRAIYRDDNFETLSGCCCMTFFLSNRVDSRSRNYN
jgi:hypothetical protein